MDLNSNSNSNTWIQMNIMNAIARCDFHQMRNNNFLLLYSNIFHFGEFQISKTWSKIYHFDRKLRILSCTSNKTRTIKHYRHGIRHLKFSHSIPLLIRFEWSTKSFWNWWLSDELFRVKFEAIIKLPCQFGNYFWLSGTKTANPNEFS